MLGILFLMFMTIYTMIVLYIQDYLHHEDQNKIPLMIEHEKGELCIVINTLSIRVHTLRVIVR